MADGSPHARLYIPQKILVVCLRKDVCRSADRPLGNDNRLPPRPGIVNEVRAVVVEDWREFDKATTAGLEGSPPIGNWNAPISSLNRLHALDLCVWVREEVPGTGSPAPLFADVIMQDVGPDCLGKITELRPNDRPLPANGFLPSNRKSSPCEHLQGSKPGAVGHLPARVLRATSMSTLYRTGNSKGARCSWRNAIRTSAA